MEQLRVYLQILIRGWWLIALTALAALNAALILSYYTTPLYQTTATFLVSPGPALLAGDNSQIIRSLEALDRRSVVATYSEVMNSETIYNEVAETLHLDPSERNAYTVNSVVVVDSSALELRVTGPNPELTVLIANGIAEKSIEYLENLYLIFQISLLDPAKPPRTPFTPTPMRDATVSLFIGIVFGAVLVLLRAELPGSVGILWKQINNQPGLFYSRKVFQEKLEQQLILNQSDNLLLGFIQFHDLQNLSESIREQVVLRVINILRQNFGDTVLIGHWDVVNFAILLSATSNITVTQKFREMQSMLASSIDIKDSGDSSIELMPHVAVVMYQQGETAKVLIDQAELALAQTYQNGNKFISLVESSPTDNTITLN